MADISPVKQRKLWMMNGTLLSLALLARGHGSDVHATLNEYLALFPVSASCCWQSCRGLSTWPVSATRPEKLEEQERLYRMRIYESARMSEARSQDEVTRILSRLSSGRPASYLRDVLGKLAEPIELLKQHGESDLLCAEALRIGFLLASETLD
ncbi:hypothetical protein [Aeromicrobium sp. UC242_57]|uniref:hypothetical protein n=1 Tax=Aeromicrobium sp. UC242_57 TaxID=3374624 RepID=UPI003792C9FF